MPNEIADVARKIRSKHFWTPVWLAFAIAMGVGGYFLGIHESEERLIEKDIASLAIAAMRSPNDGIIYAQKKLLEGKIGYDVYRDVIRAALKKADIVTLEGAFESMSQVIAASDANQRDTLKLVNEMKPVVLLALPDSSEHSSGLDKEFRAFGMDTVIVTTKDESKDNAVICYKDDTCNASAKRVKDLLTSRGYQIGDIVQISRTNAAYDKRIDVLLAPIQKATEAKPASRRR